MKLSSIDTFGIVLRPAEDTVDALTSKSRVTKQFQDSPDACAQTGTAQSLKYVLKGDFNLERDPGSCRINLLATSKPSVTSPVTDETFDGYVSDKRYYRLS
jgi:hypothetical protein